MAARTLFTTLLLVALVACDGLWTSVDGVPAGAEVTCVGFDDGECVRLLDVAIASLSGPARGDVEHATIGPSSVVVCTSHPRCRARADVEVRFRSTRLTVIVTVSQQPDGRLIAETY